MSEETFDTLLCVGGPHAGCWHRVSSLRPFITLPRRVPLPVASWPIDKPIPPVAFVTDCYFRMVWEYERTAMYLLRWENLPEAWTLPELCRVYGGAFEDLLRERAERLMR
jgi:hypothetical protein